ncbi:thioredoxin domain-containing protein [bacterium]|nr:thioredoxin domain-containing protein [bacterium]
MSNPIKTVVMLASVALLGVVACSKPSTEQLVEMVKKNPNILAEAIKKDPKAFRDVMAGAQDQVRRERVKEQAEMQAKEQEKRFEDPLQPKLGPAQVYLGAEKAKITIVEYTDFECPYCSRGSGTVKEVLKKYPGKVTVTVKHMPLPFHKNAMPAAKYFEAIRLQNPKIAAKFHDVVFEKQADLRKGGEAFLEEQAKKLGANVAKLKADLKKPEIEQKINADTEEAKGFGFRGTPAFVVGGVPVRGAVPAAEFEKIIERLLAKPTGKG